MNTKAMVTVCNGRMRGAECSQNNADWHLTSSTQDEDMTHEVPQPSP